METRIYCDFEILKQQSSKHYELVKRLGIKSDDPKDLELISLDCIKHFNEKTDKWHWDKIAWDNTYQFMRCADLGSSILSDLAETRTNAGIFVPIKGKWSKNEQVLKAFEGFEHLAKLFRLVSEGKQEELEKVFENEKQIINDSFQQANQILDKDNAELDVSKQGVDLGIVHIENLYCTDTYELNELLNNHPAVIQNYWETLFEGRDDSEMSPNSYTVQILFDKNMYFKLNPGADAQFPFLDELLHLDGTLCNAIQIDIGDLREWHYSYKTVKFANQNNEDGFNTEPITDDMEFEIDKEKLDDKLKEFCEENREYIDEKWSTQIKRHEREF